MEYITLGEKTFIRASKIAKDLGYTNDYIGQLCRSGKVEARLVGRAWYVEESSVRAHKGGRYRRSKAVSKHQLQRAVKGDGAKVVPVNTTTTHIVAAEPRVTNRTQVPTAPQYGTDDLELLPKLQKVQSDDGKDGEDDTEELREGYAALVSESSPASETVSKPSDEDSEPVVEASVAPVTEVKLRKVDSKMASIDAVQVEVVEDDSTSAHDVAVTVGERKTPVPLVKQERTAEPASLPAASAEVVAYSPTLSSTRSQQPKTPQPHLTLLIVFFLSCLGSLLLLSVEHQISVDATTVTSSYVLDLRQNLSQFIDIFRNFSS